MPTVISLATAMFVLPLVLLALHRSLSSVFDTSHLRAFQFALYILLVFFALFISVFWLAWRMAVRVTERYLVRQG